MRKTTHMKMSHVMPVFTTFFVSFAFASFALVMPAYAKPSHKPSLLPKNLNNMSVNFSAPSNALPLWAQQKISAKEAKAIALETVPGGEVVDISRDGNTYRVRVIAKDGHVVDVSVDANTGTATR